MESQPWRSISSSTDGLLAALLFAFLLAGSGGPRGPEGRFLGCLSLEGLERIFDELVRLLISFSSSFKPDASHRVLTGVLFDRHDRATRLQLNLVSRFESLLWHFSSCSFLKR